jgi:hypothetical protein
MLFTVGVGLTEIVNDSVVPEHPFNEGVTSIVAVSKVEPEFVATKD